MLDAVQALAGAAIPTLPAVLDPVELAKHLRFLSSPPWNWGEIGDVRVQGLKTGHRNRWVLGIHLHTAGGVRTLIGKVYAQDRSDVYQAMVAIGRAGFGPEATFSIAQPIAYLPALNLLLTEKLQGVRAKDVFVSGNDRDRTDAAQRCALWLARFHTRAPRCGPVSDLNGYFVSLEKWLRRIAEVGEPMAEKATRLLHRLELAAPATGPIEMCAGHGSYKPSAVILADSQTVTFDWDSYDVADPCRDVAKFIVFLERLAFRRAGSIQGPDTSADVFLKTYLAAGPPQVESRVPFFKAGVFVQFAKYDLSQPIPTWRSEMEAMLDKGLRTLEEWR